MQPQPEKDYKKIFTELIKKQIIILGPDITMAKVKNVPGIVVNEQGEVTSIDGDPQVILQSLINQFVELSGMIVKKTMESILTTYPGMAAAASDAMAGSVGAVSQAQSQEVKPDTNPEKSAKNNIEVNQSPGVISQESPKNHAQSPAHSEQMPKEDMDTINKALSELNGQMSTQSSSSSLEKEANNVSQSNNDTELNH